MSTPSTFLALRDTREAIMQTPKSVHFSLHKIMIEETREKAIYLHRNFFMYFYEDSLTSTLIAFQFGKLLIR